MLKASSLYIVIIISLVIALMCSSLIVIGYYYKLSYQKKIRADRLEVNLQSGVNILLASNTLIPNTEKIGLFDQSEDSVILSKRDWGIYEVAVCEAYIQKDTLYRSFLTASTIDSAKWAALYLIDENRPLSLSGKTEIIGNVYVPKSGIKAAYVDNKAYEGDPSFVKGHIYTSQKDLPVLDQQRLDQLFSIFAQRSDELALKVVPDSLDQSFRKATVNIRLEKPYTVQNAVLKNNIILYSDTSLVIDSSARLDNVLIFARSVRFESGFHGNCQAFASDSISIGARCQFLYPSCLGIYRKEAAKDDSFKKITVGENTQFNGVIFAGDKVTNNPTSVFITLGKNCSVRGQVYAQGIVALKDNVTVNGSIFSKKFLYQRNFSAYENYLINVKVNAAALPRYYLTSAMLPASRPQKKVLKWLEQN